MPITNVAVDLTNCALHDRTLLGLNYSNLKKKKNSEKRCSYVN